MRERTEPYSPAQQPPYCVAELGALAKYCTAQENAAQTVEHRGHKSEAALLLEPHIEQRYHAIATGSSESGLWLRIFAPSAEHRLAARLRRIEVGQHVHVMSVPTNVRRRSINFVAVDNPMRNMAAERISC